MKALLMALAPKLKGAKSKSSMDDDEAPDSEDGDGADHYKTIAKEAAKDGDWDAMIDALCSYMDNC